jgi:exopolysaccharide biosynthesis protein
MQSKTKSVKKVPSKIKRNLILVSTFIVFGIIFLLYGPFAGFRNFWITTAMHTSDHQFLARAVYSASTIDRVMAANRVIVPDSKSDLDIPVSTAGGTVEFVDVSCETGDGFMVIAHDPSKLELVLASDEKGELLEDLVADHDVIAAVNAGAYRDNVQRGLPLGIVIQDGEVKYRGDDMQHSLIGINENDRLVLGIYKTYEAEGLLDLRDSVEYGPYLLINGERMEILGNAGGIAPRTAIGQRADGSILLLVIEGRTVGSFGANYRDVQEIMLKFGAINAACLDGGSSSTMYYDGSIINKTVAKEEARRIPSAFVIKK